MMVGGLRASFLLTGLSILTMIVTGEDIINEHMMNEPIGFSPYMGRNIRNAFGYWKMNMESRSSFIEKKREETMEKDDADDSTTTAAESAPSAAGVTTGDQEGILKTIENGIEKRIPAMLKSTTPTETTTHIAAPGTVTNCEITINYKGAVPWNSFSHRNAFSCTPYENKIALSSWISDYVISYQQQDYKTNNLLFETRTVSCRGDGDFIWDLDFRSPSGKCLHWLYLWSFMGLIIWNSKIVWRKTKNTAFIQEGFANLPSSGGGSFVDFFNQGDRNKKDHSNSKNPNHNNWGNNSSNNDNYSYTHSSSNDTNNSDQKKNRAKSRVIFIDQQNKIPQHGYGSTVDNGTIMNTDNVHQNSNPGSEFQYDQYESANQYNNAIVNGSKNNEYGNNDQYGGSNQYGSKNNEYGSTEMDPSNYPSNFDSHPSNFDSPSDSPKDSPKTLNSKKMKRQNALRGNAMLLNLIEDYAKSLKEQGNNGLAASTYGTDDRYGRHGDGYDRNGSDQISETLGKEHDLIDLLEQLKKTIMIANTSIVKKELGRKSYLDGGCSLKNGLLENDTVALCSLENDLQNPTNKKQKSHYFYLDFFRTLCVACACANHCFGKGYAEMNTAWVCFWVMPYLYYISGICFWISKKSVSYYVSRIVIIHILGIIFGGVIPPMLIYWGDLSTECSKKHCSGVSGVRGYEGSHSSGSAGLFCSCSNTLMDQRGGNAGTQEVLPNGIVKHSFWDWGFGIFKFKDMGILDDGDYMTQLWFLWFIILGALFSGPVRDLIRKENIIIEKVQKIQYESMQNQYESMHNSNNNPSDTHNQNEIHYESYGSLEETKKIGDDDSSEDGLDFDDVYRDVATVVKDPITILQEPTMSKDGISERASTKDGIPMIEGAAQKVFRQQLSESRISMTSMTSMTNQDRKEKPNKDMKAINNKNSDKTVKIHADDINVTRALNCMATSKNPDLASIEIEHKLLRKSALRWTIFWFVFSSTLLLYCSMFLRLPLSARETNSMTSDEISQWYIKNACCPLSRLVRDFLLGPEMYNSWLTGSSLLNNVVINVLFMSGERLWLATMLHAVIALGGDRRGYLGWIVLAFVFSKRVFFPVPMAFFACNIDWFTVGLIVWCRPPKGWDKLTHLIQNYYIFYLSVLLILTYPVLLGRCEFLPAYDLIERFRFYLMMLLFALPFLCAAMGNINDTYGFRRWINWWSLGMYIAHMGGKLVFLHFYWEKRQMYFPLLYFGSVTGCILYFHVLFPVVYGYSKEPSIDEYGNPVSDNGEEKIIWRGGLYNYKWYQEYLKKKLEREKKLDKNKLDHDSKNSKNKDSKNKDLNESLNDDNDDSINDSINDTLKKDSTWSFENFRSGFWNKINQRRKDE